ncbi:hypothetical protein [Cohnella nanjingensis]|uniref:Uncharacterized protein n=1 Tax=Cohnella nanjingensis TaxID=1387779 RepID=A0A7X0VFS6_9BACL|nr:hypothetical protein [Cohnella nanjingensis]MBB6670929.1 hypothetical protein [Cohnella nanjingensis]
MRRTADRRAIVIVVVHAGQIKEYVFFEVFVSSGIYLYLKKLGYPEWSAIAGSAVIPTALRKLSQRLRQPIRSARARLAARRELPIRPYHPSQA